MDNNRIILGMEPAADTGIRWLNPFTGEHEVWHTPDMAIALQLQSAAQRIRELQAEIDAIKAFLVL